VSLKGDASQISLTNIFQTLKLNGQEGVLAVSSGKIRWKMRILPTGVRLLAQSRDNPDVLRQALVKQKIVSDAQFQNIISTMGHSTLFPGEFLIQRRILTPEQVEKGVSRQFLEIIYDVFNWKKAKYEFVAGDPGMELELFNPRGLGQSLVFEISNILMAVAWRQDEWRRMRKEIPSEREIFVPVDPQAFAEPRTYPGELDPESIREVKGFVDGEHTIESMASESSLSTFETYQALALLLAQREIRPLTLEEKKSLAEEMRKKFKLKEVVEIWRNLLEADPRDIDIRLKLVAVLEKKKEVSPLLVEQYQFLADHFYKSREYPQALNYLQKVAQIDPLHLDALDKLFEIHYLQKKHREAVEIARRLVEAIKNKKEFERGSEILLKVLDLYPTETFLFHELADVFVFANQTDNAVLTLKSVATLYEERGDITKLRKTYERIASMDPSEAPSLRKILETERRTHRPVRSILATLKGMVWTALTVSLLLAVGYLVSLEVLARNAYAVVKGDVDACSEVGDFRRARAILEDIARRFPVSTLPGRIAGEVRDLSAREREEDEDRRKKEEKERVQFGSYLARLENLMSSKRYLEAQAVVQDMNRLSLSAPNRKRVAEFEAELRQHFNAAVELGRSSRELIQAGRHEEAHRQSLTLLLKYASTPAAQGMKMPLLVKSVPPGATVIANGESLGVTPLTLYYSPFGKLSLTIAAEGFRPAHFGEEPGATRAIDFTRDWMISAFLTRIAAWVFDAGAPVECTPLVRGDRAYLGTRGGRIFCLDLAGGTPRWSWDVPDGWDVSSGLRWHKDRLFFGTFDGAFHILDARTGRPLHRLLPASPPRPIRHPASEATPAGVVAVNCGGAAVALINVSAGTVQYLIRTESEALGPPELSGGNFVYVTVDGTIQVLDPDSGAMAGRIPLNVRLDSAGRADNGSYIVGDSVGRLRKINLRTGTAQWTYESPMENLTSPGLGGGLVFFGSGGGLMVALDSQTGDLRWKGKVGDAITTPAAWMDGSFYIGTRSGVGICLDAATGAQSWTFAAGGPIAAAPGTGANHVLMGSDDHHVYAFTER
jgi:outer membrane protein assembly factor BamB/tetratricopeptide (TPR) repeat protein